MFLAPWAPLDLPEAVPRAPLRPQHSRRKPSSATRRTSQRAAQYPADSAASLTWHVPVAAAGSPEALRARYPLVSALLVELGAMSSRGTADAGARPKPLAHRSAWYGRRGPC